MYQKGVDKTLEVKVESEKSVTEQCRKM